MRTLFSITSALLVATSPAHATDDPLLVVPAGSGDSLEMTASVAREVMLLLGSTRTGEVKLAYPLERRAYAPRRRARLAKKHLRLAKRNYKVLEYDSVRKNAHRALKLYKEEIKRGAKPNGYVEALHYLAAAETVDGNDAAGFKWMNDAYIFDKSMPDAKISNPQVQAMHAKVAGSDDHVGTLEFEVEPGGLLWFDDSLHGAARGKVVLRAGLHLLRIGRPGYLTYEKWIRVRRNKTRKVAVRLQRGPIASEPAVIVGLRKELDDKPATSTLLLATDYGTKEVLVIGASPSCTPSRCPVKMRWAKGGQWIQSRNLTSSDGPLAIAKELTGASDEDDDGANDDDDQAAQANDSLQCRDDAQCLSDQRCKGGRCETVVPVTRKWWFWTIIGVVVAGAGATTAILLTRPENPVLEVR